MRAGHVYNRVVCGLCGRMIAEAGAGHAHHMRYHKIKGDYKDCHTPKNGVTLKSSGDHHTPNPLMVRLIPLLRGKAVALKVDDPRAAKKRRIKNNVLFITPGSQYGDPGVVVFALAGGGCEVARVDDLRASQLVMVGLSASIASILIEQLRILFSVEDHSIFRH